MADLRCNPITGDLVIIAENRGTRPREIFLEQINRESLPELASLFRRVLVKLERVPKVPAYNYIVHTAPFDTPGADHYHWQIEILPRFRIRSAHGSYWNCHFDAACWTVRIRHCRAIRKVSASLLNRKRAAGATATLATTDH